MHLCTVKTVIRQICSNQPRKKVPQSAGGCNRYLGNAQIEVPLIVMGLPLTWGKGLKKEVWPKYQGENLETKGESFSCLLPSKPGLVGCSERSARGWGRICVPESDLAQGKVRLDLQLKSCYGRGNREIKSCPKCSTPATLSREKSFTVSADTWCRKKGCDVTSPSPSTAVVVVAGAGVVVGKGP